MSTTPLTFNPSDAGPYTVVGGSSRKAGKDSKGLSIILLNRGTRPFRSDLFEELCKLGALEVISIESSPCPYDVESLVKRHDRLRFIIFSNESSDGTRIDAAMREAVSDYVFVVRGDVSINASGISSRVFSKIAEKGRLCTVPVFSDSSGNMLSTVLVPLLMDKGQFETSITLPGKGNTATLAPWDFCGIYNKKLHQNLGGFDPSIKEPWWQKLDYGVRAWLWGEELQVHNALKMEYIGIVSAEDTSPGDGYRRFFLKNLGVQLRGNAVSLPWGTKCRYTRSSGDNSDALRKDWKELKQWVLANRYRFTRDVKALAALWEWEETI